MCNTYSKEEDFKILEKTENKSNFCLHPCVGRLGYSHLCDMLIFYVQKDILWAASSEVIQLNLYSLIQSET